MPSHFMQRLTPSAALGLIFAIAAAAPLQAQDFDSMSKEERKQILSAYMELDAIDQILVVCNELAPDYAAANQAIMGEYAASHSLDSIRPVMESFAAWTKEQHALAEKTLALSLTLARKSVRGAIEKDPSACGEQFRTELFDEEFENIAAVVETYGLTSTNTAAAQPATEAIQPATEPPQPVAKPVPSGTEEIQPVAKSEQPAAAPSGDLAMPTAVVDRVDNLPGLSWNIPGNVEFARSGSAFCVWRCTVFQYVDEIHPWLIIHETVPLSAEQALDAIIADYDDKPILEQEAFDAATLASRGSMQADRVVGRRVVIDDYGSDEERRTMIAWERGGLTVVTEFIYLYSNQPPAERERALMSIVSSLQMDVDAVHAELSNPVAPTIEAAGGRPPAADQVIYAENPNPTHNALTLSLSYDDDARYLDQAVLDADGPVIEMNGSTYYHVPRQPDGATIEGTFKSADGYAGIGISVLKSSTLIFNKNGRYTTSSGSGVVGGVLVSTGSSSEGEGSYRINGYTLELRSDDGSVQQDVFFPYMSRIFYPGSDGPSDEFNFINVGGKILYRDD